jgi:hypothetical protein
MREDLPAWLGDDDEAEAEPSATRRWWLLALAALPWVAIVLLLSTGTLPGQGADRGATDPHEPVGRAGDHEAGEDHADATPSHTGGPDRSAGPEPAPPIAPAVGEQAPISDGERRAVDDRVAAVAIVVARAWLTDVGPALEVEGVAPRSDRYLEHVTVERTEVMGEHAVVTLAAVVLERDGEVYTGVRARRLAVPVALDVPPRPAGPPWWLPDTDLAPVEPQLTEEITDPEVLLSLAEALTESGLDGAAVVGAGRTADGWWVVEVGGTGATDQDDSDGGDAPERVWMRPGRDGPVVAGDRPAGDQADDAHGIHEPDAGPETAED